MAKQELTKAELKSEIDLSLTAMVARLKELFALIEDEDDDDDEIDEDEMREELEELSKKELKAILEDEEIDFEVKKKTKESKIIDAIIEARVEAEDDDDDDDDDDEDAKEIKAILAFADTFQIDDIDPDLSLKAVVKELIAYDWGDAEFTKKEEKFAKANGLAAILKKK